MKVQILPCGCSTLFETHGAYCKRDDPKEIAVVDHGNKWTVFLPFESGVDVFKKPILHRCEIHGYYNCAHNKAIINYQEATQ